MKKYVLCGSCRKEITIFTPFHIRCERFAIVSRDARRSCRLHNDISFSLLLLYPSLTLKSLFSYIHFHLHRLRHTNKQRYAAEQKNTWKIIKFSLINFKFIVCEIMKFLLAFFMIIFHLFFSPLLHERLFFH